MNEMGVVRLLPGVPDWAIEEFVSVASAKVALLVEDFVHLIDDSCQSDDTYTLSQTSFDHLLVEPHAVDQIVM